MNNVKSQMRHLCVIKKKVKGKKHSQYLAQGRDRIGIFFSKRCEQTILVYLKEGIKRMHTVKKSQLISASSKDRTSNLLLKS